MAMIGHISIHSQTIWFIMYWLGALLWGYYAFKSKDHPLLMMQLVFLLVNTYAIITRI